MWKEAGMLVRIVVGGVLALALAATEVAVMADGAEAKVLRGRTGQGHRIKITVSGRKFRINSLAVTLNCQGGGRFLIEESGLPWTRVTSGGRFRDAQYAKADPVYLRGRLGDGVIRGRLRVTYRAEGARCASRWMPFHAT
jgi:hypothetical protein